MKYDALHQLPAYRDEHLSVEAAEQLDRMEQDQSYPAHKGKICPR